MRPDRPAEDVIKDLAGRYKDVTGEDATIRIKRGAMMKPDIDMENRLVKGTITSTTPDMDGEVVLGSKLSRAFFPKQVNTVYLAHDYTKPVGACRGWSIQDGGHSMFATTYISQTSLGQDTLTMMKEKVISGFSIGFAAQDFGPPSADEVKAYGECDTIIRGGTLIEYSITPMPCNPDALVSLVSKGLIHRSSAVACGLDDSPIRKSWRAFPIVCDDGTVIMPMRRSKA